MSGNLISNTKILTIITAIAIVIGSIFLLQDGMQTPTFSNSSPRAVIIDQLYDDFPNEWFHQNASDTLTSAGYEVDIIKTKDITVDFFKKLPSLNYEFIVVRTHGVSDSFKDESVILFTGEKYQEEKYIQEQLFGLVKKASPFLEVEFQTGEHETSDWIIVNDTYRTLTTPIEKKRSVDNYYFVIPPKLVTDSMIGKFPQSTILLGGCNTLSNPSLAEALIKRGASNVIGWNDTVGVAANDEILLMLLTETLVNEKKIDDAIDSIMKNYNWGTYPGILIHFSEENI